MVDKKILDQVIRNAWSRKTAKIKPSGLDFVMDTMLFTARFKQSVQDEKPFIYEAEGKSISFKPTGMWWTTPQGNTAVRAVLPSVGSLAEGKLKYPSALGNDIDIECSTEKKRWRKEIIIKSLPSLGTIPIDAEYLEIGFEIETDFDIEVWDKQSELKFNTAFKLSELSQLESVKAWDNHIIPKPKEGEQPEAPFERFDGFLREKDGKYFLVKRISADYLREAVYPVTTDITISFGPEYEFNSATTDYISCAALDDTHFVVGYQDTGDGDQGKCIIGVITGDAIAYGAEYVFNAVLTIYISCAALDSTHFVVCFKDDGGANDGTAMIGVVTGDAIAFGSEYVFHVNFTDWISAARLDNTHFVVCWKDSTGDTSSYGQARVGAVAGDVISWGGRKNFNEAYTRSISCTGLDATHFVVAYRDQGGNNYGKCHIGVVTGTTILFGAEDQFIGSDTVYISVAALDSTHFVVGFQDTDAASKGVCRIGVVTGDDTVFGPEYELNAASTDHIWCSKLDDTHFVVSFRDISHGVARIGTVSGGDDIAFGTEYEFNAALVNWVSCSALNSKYFVIAYKDDGGDNYGIAIIGVLPLFELTGVTKDKNGTAKANCECFLCKDNLDNTASFIAHIQSDGSGNYTFAGVLDEDAQYFVISWKDDTPHVFDVTDHVLQPVLE